MPAVFSVAWWLPEMEAAEQRAVNKGSVAGMDKKLQQHITDQEVGAGGLCGPEFLGLALVRLATESGALDKKTGASWLAFADAALINLTAPVTKARVAAVARKAGQALEFAWGVVLTKVMVECVQLMRAADGHQPGACANEFRRVLDWELSTQAAMAEAHGAPPSLPKPLPQQQQVQQQQQPQQQQHQGLQTPRRQGGNRGGCGAWWLGSSADSCKLDHPELHVCFACNKQHQRKDCPKA